MGVAQGDLLPINTMEAAKERLGKRRVRNGSEEEELYGGQRKTRIMTRAI